MLSCIWYDLYVDMYSALEMNERHKYGSDDVEKWAPQCGTFHECNFPMDQLLHRKGRTNVVKPKKK